MKRKLYICDFDGTITKEDTLDHVAMKFFPDDYKKWCENFNIYEWIKAFEKRFDIEKREYDSSLEEVELDQSFKGFMKGRDIIILSGGFDYNIEKILEKNSIGGIKVYANGLKFVSSNRIEIDMKYFNDECRDCGVCKTKILEEYRKDYDEIVYIGDGISDMCASGYSDIVYAKKESDLERYLIEKGRAFISFDSFIEVE